MKKIMALSLIFAFASNMLSAKVTPITTEEEYTRAIKHPHVVIKFYAPWCGVCKTINTPFAEISNLPEFEAINFYEINIDDSKALNNKHAIIGVPTIVQFKDGVEVKRSIGVKNEATFKKDLSKAISDIK